MRGFFRSACITIFVLLLPVTLLLALPKINGYSAEKLKAELRKEKAYQQLDSLINTQLQPSSGSESGGQGLDLSQALVSQVKDAITPAYLQTKIEGVIDSSAAWITGKSTQPPTVSLNDLKQQVLAKQPDLSAQLTQLQDQVKQFEQEGGSQLEAQLNQQNLDPQTKAQIQQALQQSKNLESVSQGDYTFSLEQPLTGLRLAYQVYSIALPVMVGLLVVLAVAIVLPGMGAGGRLGGLGWALVVGAVWNGVLVAVVSVLEGQVETKVLNVAIVPGQPAGLASIFYHSLKNTVMANYLPIEIGVSVAALVIGIVLLVAGRMMKRQTTAMPPAPSVDAGPTVGNTVVAGTVAGLTTANSAAGAGLSSVDSTLSSPTGKSKSKV